jgi:hypothetical protein
MEEVKKIGPKLVMRKAFVFQNWKNIYIADIPKLYAIGR